MCIYKLICDMFYQKMLVMIHQKKVKAVACDFLTIDQHLVTFEGKEYLIDFGNETVVEV